MRGGVVATLYPGLNGRTGEEAMVLLVQNVLRCLLTGSSGRYFSRWAPEESTGARGIVLMQEEKSGASPSSIGAAHRPCNFGAASSLAEVSSCRGLEVLGFRAAALDSRNSPSYDSFRKESVLHKAGVFSRWSSHPFVRTSAPFFFNRKPHPGVPGGIVGHQASRGGSIWIAPFDACSGNQPALIGSRISYRLRGAAGNLEFSTERPSSADGQVAPGVNYAFSTNRGRSHRMTAGGVGFSPRLSSQSTKSGPGGRGPIVGSADGSQKVVARISNAPKFLFKGDLLWLLKGCNITAEDLVFVYDTKYRLKFIQLHLPSVESFRLAQRTLAVKGRFGGRYLKMTSEEVQLDDLNKVLGPFRGRSLLLVKVPFGVITEDMERFFSGYALDSNYPMKFVRSAIQVPFGSNQNAAIAVKPEYEMRTLVRFKTELEALRALREKQGAFCLEKPVDLRFIE